MVLYYENLTLLGST